MSAPLPQPPHPGPSAVAHSNGSPSPQARPRTVLVLGGGGMRGMAHVGVLKRAAHARHPRRRDRRHEHRRARRRDGGRRLPLEKIESLVSAVQKEDYFRLNVVKFLLKGARAAACTAADTSSAAARDPAARRLRRDAQVPFYCNAVRLETGGSVFWGTPGLDDISAGRRGLRSCALPGIFEPYERDGYNYMDGGMVDSAAAALRQDAAARADHRRRPAVKGTFKTPNYKSTVLDDALPHVRDRRGGDRRADRCHMHVDYQPC
jgi:NTE family protein